MGQLPCPCSLLSCSAGWFIPAGGSEVCRSASRSSVVKLVACRRVESVCLIWPSIAASSLLSHLERSEVWLSASANACASAVLRSTVMAAMVSQPSWTAAAWVWFPAMIWPSWLTTRGLSCPNWVRLALMALTLPRRGLWSRGVSVSIGTRSSWRSSAIMLVL